MAEVKKKIVAAPTTTDAPVKKDVGGVGAFALPTMKSSPMTAMENYSWLVYGAKKIGKTTLLSMFDETYFLMTEPGTKALSVYGGDYIHSSWTTIVAAIKALRVDKKFKHVCVDSADLMFAMCQSAMCAKLGISHPSEEEWGKGWGAVRDEFTKYVQLLLASGKGVTFISHSTEREIKRRDGGKYDRIQPTLSGQARDVIEAFVDIWAYYDYEGDNRVLTIKGDENTLAGHRLQENFRWKGVEVEKIIMSPTPQAGYQNLIDCFNNKYNPEGTHISSTAPSPLAIVKKKV